MKKLFGIGLLALVIGFGMQSCEKQNVHPNSTSTSNSLNEKNKDIAMKTSTLRVWYDYGGSNYGCRGTDGNCRDDVNVSPTKHTKINNLAYNANNGDPIDVITELSNDYSFYATIFDNDMLDGVINGSLSLTAKGNLSSSTMIFFHFIDVSTLTSVQPLN